MTRRLLAALFVTAAAFVLVARAEPPDIKIPAVKVPDKTADKSKDDSVSKSRIEDLPTEQDRLQHQFDEFKNSLLRLAQRLENSAQPGDKEKAEVIKEALKTAGALGTDGKFRKLVGDLKSGDTFNDTDKLQDVIGRNDELRKDLNTIIEILMKDDKDSQLKKKREEIARMLEQLKDLISKEERIRVRNDLKRQEGKDIAPDQQKANDKMAKLVDPNSVPKPQDYSKSEGKLPPKGEAKEGKAGEPKNDTKDPKADDRPKEGKPADSKPGDDKESKPGESKDGKPSDNKETKPGDSKDAKAADSKENKPGDQKDGKGGDKPESKSGDPKEAKGGDTPESKPSDSKAGDSKDGKPGEGKGAESKPGDSKESKPGDSKESKGGDSKDGKGGDKPESKPSDGKPGDSKDGKPGENKPGASTPGDNKNPMNPKPGEGAKPSDGKPSDNAGKQGEPKPGDGKPGGKPGEAKPGEGKPGDGKPSDGKPSDSKGKGDGKGSGKPGEGKPGEGKPGEGKPSPSQPGQPSQSPPSEAKPGGGAPPPGGKPPPPPPPSDLDPARKKIKDAQQSGDKAKNELEKNKDAGKDIDDTVDRLKEAQKRLEELLRSLREEEAERILAQLKARCEKMKAMQIAVRDGTVNLEKIIQAHETHKPDRADQQVSNGLADKEDAIVKEANGAIRILDAEGSAVAFAEVFKQVREDMVVVKGRLDQTDTGVVTVQIENDIIGTLDEMIDALTKAIKANKKPPPPPKPGQPGKPQPQKLIDEIAELKMIRSMQEKVNKRTTLYGLQYPGEQADPTKIKDPKIKAQVESIVDELQKLSNRQDQIHKITDDIAKGKNQNID